ncbi:helix-turn-helix domain-containing protein [Natronobeatus ordinarius]|uniref:helix-turn-helix domain-containing protein n=1 Tax=Natronobeatus ordinarius TaxID=2963433 RepID=UPI0020CC38DB|nr:helix-turn-helix domain-containing protein [Natronobeatus ordinarius]
MGVRSALTERQREVLQAALEVNYYETPRRATAADVADHLGCTASTASEHLREAEARVIRELFDG